MKWLGSLFRTHKREFKGADFSVRIEPIGRETTSVNYTKGSRLISLESEYYYRPNLLSVRLKSEVAPEILQVTLADLATAFRAMGYEYQIFRQRPRTQVPEAERDAAVAELRAMGFTAAASEDGRTVATTKMPGYVSPGIERLRTQGPRMMQLVELISGWKSSSEILAQSKEFD